MNIYRRTSEEALMLVCWWVQTGQDGSRGQLFHGTGSVGETLAYFERPDVTLIYETDDYGIWWVMWFDPMFDVGSCATWGRADKRRTRQLLKAMEAGWEYGLSIYPALYGVTRRELLKVHRHFGYTIVGELPMLRRGRESYMVVLTAEGYHAAKAKRADRARSEVTA